MMQPDYHKIFKEIIGQKVCRSLAGYGSIFSLKFEKRENESRSWSIWVRMSDWKIEIDDRTTITSDFSSRDDFKKAMDLLNNSVLIGGGITGEFNECNLVFDNGMNIEIFGVSADQDNHTSWEIFTGDFHALTFGPGSKIEYRKIDGN